VKRNRLLLIDSNALIHRSYHALPPLTDRQGHLVNAVYGYLISLFKAIDQLKPEFVIATFDTKAPTFRHKEYKEYKAKRVKAPDELYEQIPLVEEALSILEIPIMKEPGFEADDVIATIARQAEKKNIETIIVTGDMDTFQLVSDKIKVWTFKKGLSEAQLYGRKEVLTKLGVYPEFVTDYKGLRGDPSDNIPGVAKVGEKTAVVLLQKYNTIENIYDHLEELEPKYIKLLKDQKENALFSKKLATLADAPVNFNVSESKLFTFDRKRVIEYFDRMGFKSLIPKIPILGKIEHEKKDIGLYTVILSREELIKLVILLKKVEYFSFDTETDALDVFSPLVGFSISFNEKEAYYIPIGKNYFSVNDMNTFFGPILKDPSIKKIGHNIKYDYQVIKNNNLLVNGYLFDTILASYILNPVSRTHSLDSLSLSEFQIEKTPITDLIGVGKNQITMSQVPIEKIGNYACEDADIAFRLYKKFESQLKDENLDELYFAIEFPLCLVLAEMELSGIKLDLVFLKKLSKKIHGQLQKITDKIYKMAGREFNINSPQQLSEILFVILEINSDFLKKTKTGISTAAGELEKLRGAHPIIELILQYREMQKLLSTYIDSLPLLINKKTGRLHTSFNQTVTATGRLSSSSPNLQNIPIRTDLGNEIRKAFIADAGYTFLSADYSQIELRVVAHLSGDPKLKNAFLQGHDFHQATAANILGIDLEKVTPHQRRIAKTINFGVLYGMSVFGLSQSLGITREEASDFIERYFETYYVLKTYLDSVRVSARKEGFVKTLFGRKRPIPEINSKNQQIRFAAERMAINMPVQGTAADIIKLAMITLSDQIKERNNVRMLLSVHDELIFEVKKEKLNETALFVKKIMEEIITLAVPLIVDIKTGKNWGEMKKLGN